MSIQIEDVLKLDLRIGRVTDAIRVEGSDKLLKLAIDLGTETRTIVAGIGKGYEPGALVGHELVIVANLAPRVLMGIESQGMVLAASGETPVILIPEREVQPGSPVR